MKKSFLNPREKVRTGFWLSAQNIERIIFYLSILFLPVQLGRHFWPHFSIIQGIRIDYLSPTLYITDILIFLLFIQFLIFNNENSFQISNFKLQAAAFIVLLVGIVVSKSPMAGIYGLAKLFEFGFLGFYIARNIHRFKFQNILLVFSLGIIFESLLSIAQYFNHGSVNGIFYFFGERFFNSQTPGIANASLAGELFLRPYGTFPHPNVLAGYLIVGMILIIFNLKFSIKSKFLIFNFKTFLPLTSLVLGTSALFLTLSRVAIIVWFMILGIFLFRKFLNLPRRKAGHKSSASWRILILLIVGFLILGLATPLGARFTQLKLTDESIVQRGNLIENSLTMIKNHPIFGVGLNNFLVNLPFYQKSNAPFFYLQPVHNIFVLITAETGMVGIGFFIWFIAKTYGRIMNFELRIKEKKAHVLHNSCFILLSSVLILGMFDHYFLTLQQGQLLFGFVLGFCWSVGGVKKK